MSPRAFARSLSRPPRGALVAAAALAVAACGSSGGAGVTSTPPSAPGSADAGVVAVSGFEYGFTPSTISVPAGEVAFAVTNTGTVEHEFEVFRGETVVDEVGGPGARAHPGPQGHPRSRRLPVRLQISGREQAGMTGTLTVVE